LRGPIKADLEDPRLLNELVKNWLKGSALGAELQLTLLEYFDPTSSTELYRVRVQNVGRATVYNIVLTESHSKDDDDEVTTISVGSIGVLEQGDQQEIAVGYSTPPPAGLLHVAIQAVGSSQSGFPVPVYGQVRGRFVVPALPPTDPQ
jgi:hypothetical protein